MNKSDLLNWGKAALLGGWLMIAACTTPSRMGEAAELSIRALPTDATVTPELDGAVLRLGPTRIEPWAMPVPDCNDCDLRIERRYSPVGPDVILSLYQGEQLRWRLIDSRQPQLRLAGGSLIKHQAGVVRWQHGSDAIELSEGQGVSWQGCRHHLNWLATLAIEPPAKVAPEAATTRLQLTTICPL